MQREAAIEAEAMEVAIKPKSEQQSYSHPALDSTPPDTIQHTMEYIVDQRSQKKLQWPKFQTFSGETTQKMHKRHPKVHLSSYS